MKKLIFIFVLLSSINLFAQNADIVNAMKDEMARTKKDLFLKGSQKIHFAAYFLYDNDNTDISATLGALNYNTRDQHKEITVDMHVGSAALDNTGFGKYSFSFNSSADGYQNIRHDFWLASDSAYNRALEQYSKKQGFLKQKNITEYYADFSAAPRVNITGEKNEETFDAARFEALAKALSAVGREYKEFKNFNTKISYKYQQKYYLNSENSSFYGGSLLLSIEVFANLQTEDGFEINKKYSQNYASLKDIPSEEILLKEVQGFAANTAKFARAKKAESFIGPVLFSRGGALSFFDVFIEGIQNTKPYLYSEYNKDYWAGELAQRLGLRVINVNFDVADEPQLKEYKGLSLTGYAQMDDEGVVPQRVALTQNGKLENLLTTRSLIKNQKTSNGHGFYTGNAHWQSGKGIRAAITNLFFTPKVTVPEAQLKAKLIEECAKLNLEYCLRTEDNTDALFKIFVKDGHEEPVYGAEITNLDARALRDILYAGDDITVYNRTSSSVIAPSVIVGEIEIIPSQKQPAKKPIVPKPQ